MKKAVFLAVGIFLTILPGSSMARSVLPPVSSLEATTVRSVEYIINQMPIGPNPDYAIVTFDVMSGGCTDAEDFELVVRGKGKTQELSIYRLQFDPCEAIPFIKTISIRTEAINRHSNLFVKNPVLLDVQVVH